MKVVINKCFGGFSISEKAYQILAQRKNLPINELKWGFIHIDESRTDSDLIEVIEILGEQANDDGSKLKIVEVPDDADWYIDEYDGLETIYVNHDIWE